MVEMPHPTEPQEYQEWVEELDKKGNSFLNNRS